MRGTVERRKTTTLIKEEKSSINQQTVCVCMNIQRVCVCALYWLQGSSLYLISKMMAHKGTPLLYTHKFVFYLYEVL